MTPTDTPTSIIEPLPGSLAQSFKKCGRPGCKCARGELHGPYLIRVWYEGKTRRRAYVSAKDMTRVEAGIKLFDVERRLVKQRAYLAQRIGARQRALLAPLVAELEAKAQALRMGL
jgi:hypothetical protein